MTDIPAALAARPLDRRGLPIPFTTSRAEDGSPDFTAIRPEIVDMCIRLRLCGLCGQKMGYWIAFLGGQRSFESRSYTDAPMHEECAEAATRLCPHIARRAPKRATKTKVEAEAPQGFVLDKPDRWVIGITRACEYDVRRGVIRTAPFKRARFFSYRRDGSLYEEKS